MRAIAAGVTDVGRERDHNEDRFVLLPEYAVYVVADGMGGHQCGEIASRMATAAIASYFRREASDPNKLLVDVLRGSVHNANDKIHSRATNSALHRGMGTTIVVAAFHREERMLYVAHAGDSRCYCLRDGRLSQLTRDHSLVEEALRTRPDITANELAYLPANVITRALGVDAVVDAELTVEAVKEGDMYLLCSDGLHGFVKDDRIEEILKLSTNLTGLCAELVAEANRNGGGDNITAVVVRMEPVDEPWAESPSSMPPRSLPQPPAPAKDANETIQITTAASSAAAIDDASVADGVTTDKPSKRRRRRRRRRKKKTVVNTSKETVKAAVRAKLEVDDTEQLTAVSDADEVLRRRR